MCMHDTHRNQSEIGSLFNPWSFQPWLQSYSCYTSPGSNWTWSTLQPNTSALKSFQGLCWFSHRQHGTCVCSWDGWMNFEKWVQACPPEGMAAFLTSGAPALYWYYVGSCVLGSRAACGGQLLIPSNPCKQVGPLQSAYLRITFTDVRELGLGWNHINHIKTWKSLKFTIQPDQKKALICVICILTHVIYYNNLEHLGTFTEPKDRGFRVENSQALDVRKQDNGWELGAKTIQIFHDL